MAYCEQHEDMKKQLDEAKKNQLPAWGRVLLISALTTLFSIVGGAVVYASNTYQTKEDARRDRDELKEELRRVEDKLSDKLDRLLQKP